MKANLQDVLTAKLELPLADPPEATIVLPQHLELTLCSPRDVPLRSALYRMRRGLADTGAKLISGRPVWSYNDMLRYMLERVDAATRERAR